MPHPLGSDCEGFQVLSFQSPKFISNKMAYAVEPVKEFSAHLATKQFI